MTDTQKNKRLFWGILVLGLALRLFIAYFQYSGDIKNHFVWGNGLLSDPVGLFSRHFVGFNDPNYPPLAIIFFGFANLLHNLTVEIITSVNQTLSVFPSVLVPLFISENMRYAFLKFPGIVADVFTFVIILKILEKQKNKRALLFATLYFFNPAVIYISSVWGQIEPLTNLFLAWSLYLGLCQGQSFLSPLIFVLGVLTKQTTLWFAPFYLILWLKQIPKHEYLKSFALSFGTFFLFYLPFWLLPLEALRSYLSTLSGSSNLVSDAAWNIWYFLFPKGTQDSIMLGPISVRNLSVIALFLSLTFFVYKLFRQFSVSRLLNFIFIWSLLVFFFQTRVHERHLAPALLFCLITPGLFSRYLLDFLFLSVYHMFNLFWSLRLPFI